MKMVKIREIMVVLRGNCVNKCKRTGLSACICTQIREKLRYRCVKKCAVPREHGSSYIFITTFLYLI